MLTCAQGGGGPTFKRGDSDEVLNSIANFNITVKACGLEAVSYSERVGSVAQEEDLGDFARTICVQGLPGRRVDEGRVWRTRWIR